MNKERIKEIVYDLQCEFENELDCFEYSDKELSDDDLDLMCYFLNCYVGKLNLLIDSEVE